MKKISIAFILLTVLYIGVMDFLYPLQGDDFMLINSLRGNGIGQLIVETYCDWTMRSGDLFNFFCAQWEKVFFNVLNPFLQLLLVYAVFLFGFHRSPDWRDWKDSVAFALLLSMICVWMARPRDTVFWMCGCGIYTVGLFFWFFFWGLVFSADQQRKTSAMRTLFLGVLGFLAAASLENTMACGCLIAAFLLWRRKRAKLPLKADEIAGLIGYGAGVAAMVLAPGRRVRMLTVAEQGGNALSATFRFFEIALFSGGSAWFALLLLLISGFLLWKWHRQEWNKERLQSAALLVLAGCSSGVFWIGRVTPAVRAYLFFSILIALAAVRFLYGLLSSPQKKVRMSAVILTCGVLLGASAVMATAIPDFIQIHKDQQSRETLIGKAKKGDDVSVPAHSVSRRRFFQYIWIEDFTDDPQNPFNRHAAEYYHLHSLKTDRNAPTPLFWKKR